MTLSGTSAVRCAYLDKNAFKTSGQPPNLRVVQADQLLTEQADERDNKRLEKTRTNKQYVARLCLHQTIPS